LLGHLQLTTLEDEHSDPAGRAGIEPKFVPRRTDREGSPFNEIGNRNPARDLRGSNVGETGINEVRPR